MGSGEAKHELILLFDALRYEPKKMSNWLKGRGQDYSYYTLKRYYGYWSSAKMQLQAIMESKELRR